MFNLAIDSKLRGCDVVALKVEDVAPNVLGIFEHRVGQRFPHGIFAFVRRMKSRSRVC